MKIAHYLVRRLESVGLRHMFNVPGDYTLALLDYFLESKIELIGTCNELNAAYAADGYARVKGIGAVCVTYCVGGLSALNGVAGSYAENVPVVVVTGGPSRAARAKGTMMHHSAGAPWSQLEAFRQFTVDARIIADPVRAHRDVDEAISNCLRHKRPVYLEFPTDVLSLQCPEIEDLPPTAPLNDDATLKEALDEATAMLTRARAPVLLSGAEVMRLHLEDDVERLMRASGFPTGVGLMGKSSVNESDPRYFGLYMGGLSREPVLKRIQESDAVLVVGGWLTDSTTGGFSYRIDENKTIAANAGRVRIGHHVFEPVDLGAFVKGLTERFLERSPLACGNETPDVFGSQPYVAREEPLTMRRFMERIQRLLSERTMLVCDMCDGLFWSSELLIPRRGSFICQGYYLSIGYGTPAALGVGIAAPEKLVIALVGDGGFQLTCQEFSTIVRTGAKAVVFVLNNDGYGVERIIHDGPYNEIAPWKYHRLTEVLGGHGFDVRTETELERAMAASEMPAVPRPGTAQGGARVAHVESSDPSRCW
ncbi:MAG: alpha-keto acid decarboxylase family protein [Candidatus Riflebacteria bacterium]|nr:alpha-keto acid decarboxylase family protein [Candidatus Riflebacteria bacterium]